MIIPIKALSFAIPRGKVPLNKVLNLVSQITCRSTWISWRGRRVLILFFTLGVVACGGWHEDNIAATTVTEITPHGPQSEIKIKPGTGAELIGIRCANYEPILVTDLEIHEVPLKKEPSARVPFQDPVFNTCIVRVTDRFADLSPDDPSLGLKNEYSRVQSFNADDSLILVFSITGNWYIYDGWNLTPRVQIPIDVEPRWDFKDPDLLYFITDSRLMAYRVSTGSTDVIHNFGADLPGEKIAIVWTRYEGSPSSDSRYWGLMAEDEDWHPVALLIYDLETDQVIAKRMVDREKDIDSVSISPLGNYFLAFHDDYCDTDSPGDETNPCGLMVYDRHLQNGVNLVRIIGHSDLTLDANGKEVLVFQDIDTDYISMLELDSGEITALVPIDFSYSALGFHFSGNAVQMPGWVLVSTSNGAKSSATWMDDQIFALELKQNGRIVRFAHTHSVVDESQGHDYWAEPHASVNTDFTRILFTSNWGRHGTEEVDMYLIQLPDEWTKSLTNE